MESTNSHSSSCSTLFSIASAGFPNTAFHTCVWIDINAAMKRISRLGAFDAPSVRQVSSSRTRIPIRYPRTFNLRGSPKTTTLSVRRTIPIHKPHTHLLSSSPIPFTRFCVYCTISENRNAYADSETSAVRVLLTFLS